MAHMASAGDTGTAQVLTDATGTRTATFLPAAGAGVCGITCTYMYIAWILDYVCT